MILAGDVGGTKTNVAFYDVQGGKLVRVDEKRYASGEHAGLEEIVADYIKMTKLPVTAAAFGIAGPVVNNRVHATNLPWIVDGAVMASRLGLKRVRLLNDLESWGYGISVIEPEDVATLHDGVPAPEVNSVVIAAGTGMGQCVLFWDGSAHVPMATEAGHADFAPHTVQQAELWKFMRAHFEFVSVELLLSGRGFRYVHEFLNAGVKHPGFDDPNADVAPEITKAALAKTCPTCVDTLSLWVEMYGSEAGNLALRAVARGGIYIAGGIALKILPKMKDGCFVKAVREKEKLGDFLAQIPVHVVLNEECPLRGSAYVAWKGL
ncbi:MAG TPA: glucokinase [Candidatus Micrarchaeaceae archaeon]|nr:glucokinase [Candidatus Micrarchaeaceae archaeon]